MPLVGLRMDKIEASRNNQVKIEGPVRIGTSPRILSLSESQVNSGTGKLNVLEVSFEYFTNYDPAMGNIRIDGVAMYQESEEARKKILSEWKSDNKLPAEFSNELIRQITQRSMLITMMLARELGLPSPLPLKIGSSE